MYAWIKSHLFYKTVNIWKSWWWNIMYILTLIHICQAERKVISQAFEQTWSDFLINICRLLSLLWCCLWWGCLLWVNGVWIDTAAKWSALAGGWFHLQGSIFSKATLGWSHRANQFSFTLHWISVIVSALQTGWNQYSQFVWDITALFV